MASTSAALKLHLTSRRPSQLPSFEATGVRGSRGTWRCRASEDPKNEPLPRWATRKLAAQSIFAGAVGTTAVLLGQTLDIDPFGNLHYDSTDLLVGVGCALPVLLMELAVFKLDPPHRVDVKMTIDPLGGEVQIESAAEKGQEMQLEALYGALRTYKLKALAYHHGSRDSVTAPLVEWFLGMFPSEMLFRAVGLVALGNWFRDRLYEGGVDDLLYAYNFSTDAAGKWLAVWSLIAVGLGSIFLRVSDRRTFHQAQSILKHGDGSAWERMKNLKIGKSAMEKILKQAETQEKLIGVVDSVLRLSSQVAMSTAFVVTGNLASTVAVAGSIGLARRQLLEVEHAEHQKFETELRTTLKNRQSVKQTIEGESYKRLKSSFVQKLEQMEHQDASSSSAEAAKGNENTSPDGVALDLNLMSFLFLFRTSKRELEDELAKEGLTEADRERLSSEKSELEDLISRASKLMKKGTEEKTELNFHRAVKDRYKGEE